MLEVHKRGLQAVIHANADQATEMALVAVDDAQRQYPRLATRHRIEHNQFVTQSQLVRMKQLGVATNLFTNHIYYWGDLHYSTFVGPDRARGMNPGRKRAAYGHSFQSPLGRVGHSGQPDLRMWTATVRKTMSGRVLGEGERISVPQALHAVTLGAAYLLGQDDKKGSIEAGKLADFTVLDRNPLEVASPDELKDIKVLGTVMGGKAFPRVCSLRPCLLTKHRSGRRVVGSSTYSMGSSTYNGMLSCFFQGFSSFLWRSMLSARATRLRVECGMITSSRIAALGRDEGIGEALLDSP